MNALASFAAMESPLVETLDPAIYVEAKDRGDASEDARQAAFVVAIHKQRQFEVYAVPNGGKRSQWAAAKAKREGMRAGWPDLGVVWADGEARIEFKNGRKMPEPEQVAVLNWLHARGHLVAVCRTAEGALAWLRSIGAPVSLRIVA